MISLRIKQTTGLTLNGNEISGNTYPVKDWIKAYLGGKWNSERKVWIVDTEKVESLLARGANIYVDSTPAPVTKKSASHSGWCNKCHSYCYGDCEANR